MHIAILWWSWATWSLVLQECLEIWHSVTTLVRRKESLSSDVLEKISCVVWDATKSEDIQKVLSSWIDILIHTVSVPFFHKKPTYLYSGVAQAVVDARWRVDHNCQQYIALSSFGTHHGRDLPFPASYFYEYFLGDVADDKEIEEKLLAESNLPWTVLKAVLLSNGQKRPFRLVPFQEFEPSLIANISRASVARALVYLAGKDSFLTKKIVVV